jgi:signal peptidase II
MEWTANRRIGLVAALVLVLDQATKGIVIRTLYYAEEYVLLEGFFKFVHWGNTGAAWSLFRDRNDMLAVFSLTALLLLIMTRHHFDAHRFGGQVALGLMLGGILGNLIDRLHVDHVIDFIYFYVIPRGGGEIGFPAFNLADAAICTGVGILFWLSWFGHRSQRAATGQRPGT